MLEKLLILYDGNCGLCTRSVAGLRTLKTNAVLEFMPLQQYDTDNLPLNLSVEDLYAQIHVIDEEGRLFKGAEALTRVVKTVPTLQWIAWLYRVPGMHYVADQLYKWIAKHRYQLFGTVDECENGACRLHGSKDKE